MKHFVIGKGRVGQTLLNSLKGIGENIADNAINAEIVWIVVPDSVIREKTLEIERELTGKHILVHLSGFFPASILKNTKTENLVSLHPAFSFSKPLDFFPEGIFWTYQGDDSLFRYFSVLIGKWKGHIKKISERQKALYHIACVFASNFPVVSLLIAEKLFKECGIDFNDVSKGLVMPVCKKVIMGSELEGILTGPAKRKDYETIKKEIEVLTEKDSEFAEIYRLLSDFILKNL